MKVSVEFDSISSAIIAHIKSSKEFIRICVPWLTDDEILEALIEKAKSKIFIEILITKNEFTSAKTAHFNKLITHGAKIYMLEKHQSGGILHHKFCLIDYKILISGSYNWSNQAKKNDEHILINKAKSNSDFLVLNDFDNHFTDLLYKYDIREKPSDEIWEEISDSTSKFLKAQDKALRHYESSVGFFQTEELAKAHKYANKAIKSCVRPNPDFFILKHLIYLKNDDHVKAARWLFKGLKYLENGHEDSHTIFKTTYANFVNDIKQNGWKTYTKIDLINDETLLNLSSFVRYNQTPHFFKFNELNILD